jgi:hypothetical protein
MTNDHQFLFVVKIKGAAMKFFSNLKRSAQKSRLMKSAAAQVQGGDFDTAIIEIFAYLNTDDVSREILSSFDGKKEDIQAIVLGIMASGAGGTFKGHFVPVSAVLFPDTLAYLLGSERGQVGKAEAYFQVMSYFQSGAIVFKPK